MLLKLKAMQEREGWTDAQMAVRLNVARSTWTEIKNGRLPLSDRHQVAAARAFPDLLGDLLTSITLSRPQQPQEVA